MDKRSGFTLIELLVVMAIVGTLLMLAAPRYFGGVDRAKEAVLRENLSAVRTAIDQHHADTGRYPASLDDLVTKRYLKAVPMDPVTDSSATWLPVPPADPQKGGIQDVKSGATGTARDGTAYGDW